MTVTLYTTQGDPFTVDDEDAPLVARFPWWWERKCTNGKPVPTLLTYVRPIPQGKEGTLQMRSLLLGSPPSPEVLAFTINGDPLCMEKRNLTWLDKGTMQHWCGLASPDKYRGVSPSPTNPQKWKALLHPRWLGVFSSMDEAARAYDRAARERYGPWARLNFPDPDAPMPLGTQFPPPQLPLRGTDRKAIQVDSEFLPILSRHRWEPGPEGYWAKIGSFTVPLAFLVLGRQGSGGGLAKIHWIDGDPCNCTKANLSWHMLGKAPYRGITQQGRRWGVHLRSKGQKPSLGWFDTPEEAARAYDKAAIELLGPKARLNFPLEHEALKAATVGSWRK